jgi:hypothetical protein
LTNIHEKVNRESLVGGEPAGLLNRFDISRIPEIENAGMKLNG